jgi:monovalent cation:H+ antiporter-2, CPA2 family
MEGSVSCGHLDQIRVVATDEELVCRECLELGDRWVHLRLCMTCGHIGCCDSSKNKHASRHAAAAAHPIVGSLEPGEVWQWCYLDEVVV